MATHDIIGCWATSGGKKLPYWVDPPEYCDVGFYGCVNSVTGALEATDPPCITSGGCIITSGANAGRPRITIEDCCIPCPDVIYITFSGITNCGAVDCGYCDWDTCNCADLCTDSNLDPPVAGKWELTEGADCVYTFAKGTYMAIAVTLDATNGIVNAKTHYTNANGCFGYAGALAINDEVNNENSYCGGVGGTYECYSDTGTAEITRE